MTAGIALDLLPGVRSHLRAVCADLRVGRTCLWLLPEWVRAPEHWERLVARLRDGVDLVEVEHVPAGRTTGPAGASESSMPASSVVSITTGDDILDSLFGPTAPRRPPPAAVSVGTPLLDRVLAAIADYGYPAADRDDDPVTALARWRSPHGLVLVVRADGEADTRGLRDLLERYPVLGREQALDREGMASLLIIGAPTAVPGVEQADPLITATHWWWGVVRRLDLVVLASDMSRSGRPPPHRKLLDELCGDLVPRSSPRSPVRISTSPSNSCGTGTAPSGSCANSCGRWRKEAPRLSRDRGSRLRAHPDSCGTPGRRGTWPSGTERSGARSVRSARTWWTPRSGSACGSPTHER